MEGVAMYRSWSDTSDIRNLIDCLSQLVEVVKMTELAAEKRIILISAAESMGEFFRLETDDFDQVEDLGPWLGAVNSSFQARGINLFSAAVDACQVCTRLARNQHVSVGDRLNLSRFLKDLASTLDATMATIVVLEEDQDITEGKLEPYLESEISDFAWLLSECVDSVEDFEAMCDIDSANGN